MNSTHGGKSDKARASAGERKLFRNVRVQPIAGRLFTQADDQIPEAHPLAVLSYEYWQRRFGGNAAIVRRPTHSQRPSHDVIGITPPGFYGTDLSEVTDICVPMMMATVFRPFPAIACKIRVINGWRFLPASSRKSPRSSRGRPRSPLSPNSRAKSNNCRRESATTTKRIAWTSHVKLASRAARVCGNCKTSCPTHSSFFFAGSPSSFC